MPLRPPRRPIARSIRASMRSIASRPPLAPGMLQSVQDQAYYRCLNMDEDPPLPQKSAYFGTKLPATSTVTASTAATGGAASTGGTVIDSGTIVPPIPRPAPAARTQDGGDGQRPQVHRSGRVPRGRQAAVDRGMDGLLREVFPEFLGPEDWDDPALRLRYPRALQVGGSPSARHTAADQRDFRLARRRLIGQDAPGVCTAKGRAWRCASMPNGIGRTRCRGALRPISGSPGTSRTLRPADAGRFRQNSPTRCGGAACHVPVNQASSAERGPART